MIAPGISATGMVSDLRHNVADMPFDEPVGWVMIAMTTVAVFVGPWVLVLGTRQLRQGYRIFQNDPVGAGEAHHEEEIVEVEGTARPLEKTLSGTYSNEPALAMSWRRERRQERKDNEGNTETTWRTVENGSDAVPFVVEDETGEIAVDPTGASLSISQSRLQSKLQIGKQNRRYREYEGRIEPGDDVHVYGQIRSAADAADAPGDDPVHIGDGDEVSEFVVSDGSELRTVLRYLGTGLLLSVMGALWIPIATVVFLVVLEEAFGIPIASWLLGSHT